MPSSYSLGSHFEEFVLSQLASGRYRDESEVLRSALRLMEDHERRHAVLDGAIACGLADIESGRLHDADRVFDELEAQLSDDAHQRVED